MQSSPIQIGPIALHGFEVPTAVRFGGRYRLAVHTLAGGRRILERLGPDDAQITFQGTFTGPEAESRVRAFDSLRLAGNTVWLTWESFRRRVVIQSFDAEYTSPWWIPYRVSCLVAHQAGDNPSQKATLSALISADITSAMASVSGLQVSLAPLQAALLAPNALSRGTNDQALASSAAGSTLVAIQSQIALQSSLIDGIAPTPTGPGTLGPALATSVASAGMLASAVNAASYVGRIGVSLNGANT